MANLTLKTELTDRERDHIAVVFSIATDNYRHIERDLLRSGNDYQAEVYHNLATSIAALGERLLASTAPRPADVLRMAS